MSKKKSLNKIGLTFALGAWANGGVIHQPVARPAAQCYAEVGAGSIPGMAGAAGL